MQRQCTECLAGWVRWKLRHHGLSGRGCFCWSAVLGSPLLGVLKVILGAQRCYLRERPLWRRIHQNQALQDGLQNAPACEHGVERGPFFLTPEEEAGPLELSH